MTVSFINLFLDIFYIGSTDDRGETKLSVFQCFTD